MTKIIAKSYITLWRMQKINANSQDEPGEISTSNNTVMVKLVLEAIKETRLLCERPASAFAGRILNQ